MASVSSRPERKLDEIVTPRAAMMTERSRHFNHRLTQSVALIQIKVN